jgi:glycosyltransferase involved in cell wall biosynthesis
VSIVIPAYHEGESIIPILERIAESVSLSFECIVVIDQIEDPTVPIVNDFAKQDQRFSCSINTLGRGPALAIRHGFDVAKAKTAVVTMADGSDDPRIIDSLARLVERGVVIAAASRYMSGGQQVGATGIKSLLSRIAGVSLFWLARVGTHDATNSFKAYDVDFVRSIGIQSEHGFELGLELTAKARRLRRPVAEIPTIWLERNFGESNFQVKKWLPHYLAWYRFAYGKSADLNDLNKSSERLLRRKSRIVRNGKNK